MVLKNVLSEDMRAVTRDILDRVDFVAFTVDFSGVNKGCNMINIHSKTHGYITMKDALEYNWRVFDKATDDLLGTFETIEELMDAGWKVST